MRVSTIGLTNRLLTGLQRASASVEEASVRTQSGLKISRPSDDPNGAASLMNASSSLRALEQYQRNISSASARLNMEEEVLGRLTDTLDRAKQLGLQEGSATANAQTRLVAKAEVDQLLAFAVQLANSRHEGEFLFGGDQPLGIPIPSTTSPFSPTTITGQRFVEIGEAQRVPVVHNAKELFLDSNVLAALEELSIALGTNDAPGIATSLSSIDGAHLDVQALIGDVGARSSQFDVARSNLQALDSTLQAFKSDLQDLDLEEAVTHLVSKQNAYQAALLTTSRVMSVTLADYLR